MTSLNGVKPEHTYWSSVVTAGWVDIEWAARTALEKLPPGYRMALKHIDTDDMAWCYRNDIGVVKVPAWCLDPYQR